MTPNLIVADTLTGAPGATVSVPISISDATGLQSLDVTLKYDTSILTIVDPNEDTPENEGVKRTGLAANWKITSGEGDNPDRELSNPVANVNRDTGEVKISLVNPGEPLTEASGEIIEIDFKIKSDATIDSSVAIDLQKAEFGINNEPITVGDSDSNLNDGIFTVTQGNYGPAEPIKFDGKDDFAVNQGWNSQDVFPRMIGDFNGDGKDDIIGFGNKVRVALANDRGGFDAVNAVEFNGKDDFVPSVGWNSQDVFPRMIGDFNGDGKDDISGFGFKVRVALANEQGFGTAEPVEFNGVDNFTPNQGWNSQDVFPRLVGNLDIDNQVDIIGFGQQSVLTALI